MIRDRLSRILFLGKFFNYPLKLNMDTLKKLGFKRLCRIGFSYAKARVFPIKKERSLEDFIINRFGKELYLTFFKDYTEKVWGVPCNTISPEWGRQRIKSISLTSALKNALKRKKENGISQKDTETSLIEKFMYPKLGPGQLWETALDKVKDKAGEVYFDNKVIAIQSSGNRIVSISTKNEAGEIKEFAGDYFISSMPVIDLINGLGDKVPEAIKTISNGLVYRDFIMIGILANHLKITGYIYRKNMLNWVDYNCIITGALTW
jgi:protoporphyrinogen oxidase